MRGMLNSQSPNLLEKQLMSNGVLIFAYNSTFDYVAAAKFAAKQVKAHLGLPVTLVTDEELSDPVFDCVIVKPKVEHTPRFYRNADDIVTEVQWFNKNRASAYELSPYDNTLLIDADYFMFNDSLRHIFDTQTEFACFAEINDVAVEVTQQARLSECSIPMQWATVVYFTKSEFAKSVFDFMEIIRDNWEYYSLLYNFRSTTYRNDYALSIALQALSGYSTSAFNTLPGKLHTIFTHVHVPKVTPTYVVVAHNGSTIKISNTNLHVMNKQAMEKFYE